MAKIYRSNTGAIGSWVIVAKNEDLVALPQRHLQNEGNDMGFGSVVFTNRTVLGSAGGIEVSQGRIAPIIGVRVVLQELLENEFAEPVWIDGDAGLLFRESGLVPVRHRLPSCSKKRSASHRP